MTRPRRTPRRPEHRVLLVHPADRGQQHRRRGPGPRRVASATATFDRELLQRRQELVQRRVDQPDGHRQPVHRRGRCSTKSARCSGSSAASAASPLLVGARPGSAARRARGGRRGTCARCGTGRCPRRRSAGPGPRPRRCRRWSAPPAAAACRRAPGAGVRRRPAGRRLGGRASPSKYRTTGGRLHRHLAEVDPAGGAVDRDDVALVARSWPSTVNCRLATSTSSASAPHTQVLPMPRATTAAWRGLAAAAGEDALRGDHAGQVVRVGLAADQDHRLARRRPARPRGAASKTTLPTAAPGEAATPRGERRRVGGQVEAREHQLGQLGAGDPVQRLVEVDDALVDELARR